MKARDIMTRDPTAVVPSDTITRAAELMRDRDVGMMPVVDDLATMRLQGVLTDRDITVRCVAAGHTGTCRVRDHMTTTHLDTVREADDLRAIIDKMEADQVRRVPVVADGGRLVGLISQADLATKVGPKDPKLIEEVIERISEPARARS